jgi:hypothetical protein
MPVSTELRRQILSYISTSLTATIYLKGKLALKLGDCVE